MTSIATRIRFGNGFGSSSYRYAPQPYRARALGLSLLLHSLIVRRNFYWFFRVAIEDIRAQANHELTQSMCEREETDWYRFGKKLREWEKQLEDPDDVYLQVEQREEERRKRGLPPRIGILHPTPEEPEPQTRPEASGRRRARR